MRFRLLTALAAISVLAQISLGIRIVLAGGDGRMHELLAGATVLTDAGLVWGLLATLSRPGERRVFRRQAWRAASAAPAAPR